MVKPLPVLISQNIEPREGCVCLAPGIKDPISFGDYVLQSFVGMKIADIKPVNALSYQRQLSRHMSFSLAAPACKSSVWSLGRSAPVGYHI